MKFTSPKWPDKIFYRWFKPDANTITFRIFLIFIVGVITILAQSPFVLSLLVLSIVATIRIAIIWAKIRWLFYAIIVVFLGGIIVAFTYCSSLNSFFKISTRSALWVPVLSFPFVIAVRHKPVGLIFIRFYNNFNMAFSMRIIVFTIRILLTLIVVVKIVSTYEGPLKL